MFSFLNPSNTRRSMKRVKSVLQSKERNRLAVGGVMKREKIAAKRDTTKTICFLQKVEILFIVFNALFALFFSYIGEGVDDSILHSFFNNLIHF